MSRSADVPAASALNAVVWVFAGMTVVILVMFAVTMWLAIRHRSQRRKAGEYLDNAERWVADPAGRLDNLTVGDLVGDPELRQAILQKRSQLTDIVATTNAPDPPSASTDPDSPTTR